MKQANDQPLPAKDESRNAKVSQASDSFVDLFRRIVAETHKEKVAHG